MLTKRYLVTGLTILLVVVCSSLVVAQTVWERHAGNPVLSPSAAPAWDQEFAAATTVMFHDGIFKMWYEGDNSFGYATSPDGITWSKYAGNPVMVPGPDGSWDEMNIDAASVVVVADTFHMMYSAVDSTDKNRIGHATSPDGIVWTKDPANPVIVPEPLQWDAHEAMHPFLMYEDDAFRLWYNGHDGLEQRILYATSQDCSVWSKFTSLVMLEPGASGQWDENELGPMCVVRANDGYHMWYTGWNLVPEYAIGYATSPDGITWDKDMVNNPVFEPGTAGSWDDLVVVIPVVRLKDSLLSMWYTGTDGSLFQTGYATSQSTLVPTYLYSFNAARDGLGVAIEWRLSEVGIGARFSVLRNASPGGNFVPLPGAEIVNDGLSYTFTDKTVAPGAAYRYRIKVSDADGERFLFETDLITMPALTLELNRISPNPFNPQTTIVYTIDEAGPVTLGVYDAAGRLIRQLVNESQTAGRYTETWSGRNTAGATVASGVYFIRLESRKQVITKKAVLSK